jgi:opacity protein-like surface antigen
MALGWMSMRLMKLALCAAAVVAGSDALAGFDEPVLRGSSAVAYAKPPGLPRYVPGSPVRYRWDGFYVGGQAGYSNAGFDLGTGTASLLDFILRNDVVGSHVADWTALTNGNSSRGSFGGFIGTNIQLDELVFGFEASYNLAGSDGISHASNDSMTRTFQDDTAAPAQHHYFYTVGVSSVVSARLTDFGTVRARAGVAFDNFLPYVFAGGAIGRVDVRRTASVAYVREDIPDVVAPIDGGPLTPQAPFFFGPETRGENRKGVFAYGYTAGLGMDIAIMPNLFFRAEWEYIQFAPVMDVNIYINTLRAGLGFRF